jgi:hypothetical protein
MKFLERFQVVTVEDMKIAVFWVVAPCSLIKVYHFRGNDGIHDRDGKCLRDVREYVVQ